VGWRSWRDIAAAWESAVSKESGSAAAIKTFKNTELGETWVEEGEAPDWQRLLERREDYPIGTVPAGGLLLVGGADVQKDRIEASIWAFGRGKETRLVEHRVLMGDTAREVVWAALGELLEERWTHASAAVMPLARFALDTGFATQEAYAFVRARRDRNGFPVREWQKLRERNEALDAYVYGRAAASAAGLDRFEERHWRELERQLGVVPDPTLPPAIPSTDLNEATRSGGLGVSGRRPGRRVIKSRWLDR
jgi:phage terminase large subunit GpA-like protein